MGQFVGQDTLAQICQGQVDSAGAHEVKGLQGVVAEKPRMLARHHSHMLPPHLFAVRQEHQGDPGRPYRREIEKAGGPLQDAVDFGG